MNILYVVSRSLEINTSASIRNSALIQGLCNLGHQVHLVTTKPDRKSEYYDASLLPHNIQLQYITDKTTGGVLDWAKRNSFMKPLKKLISSYISKVELYDSQKWIIKNLDQVEFVAYDCVISSSDPKSSHLFVYEAVKKFGDINWVQIWGDPFLGDVSISKSIDKEVLYKEEKKLLENATRVYYVSEPTLSEQISHYPEFAYKMSYIPIPYLNERIYDINNINENAVVELCYCGDYPSSYRNILPLYEAVKSMKRVHLTICGGSDVRLKNCAQVTILPRQTHNEVDRIEGRANILVHICNSSGSQIPGKIYQYSGTNKPILFILDGEIELHKKQFEKYNRYDFCINDKMSITHTIEKIIYDNQKYGPVNEFSKENVVKKIKLISGRS